MFAELTTNTTFAFFLIFCRIGTALMIFPTIGAVYVSVRVRLILALMICVVLTPVLSPTLPGMPSQLLAFTILILTEIFTGIFIGILTQIAMNTLHMVGMIIATQSGLGAAVLFDPNQGAQGSIIGNFMTLLAVTLIIVTELHHLFLQALVDSYTLFKAGKVPFVGDMSDLVMTTVSKSFLMAVKMSAPQTAVALMMMLGGGVLSRLMPNLQIFFIFSPAQILVSFIILLSTLSALMMWYMDYIAEVIGYFLV